MYHYSFKTVSLLFIFCEIIICLSPACGYAANHPVKSGDYYLINPDVPSWNETASLSIKSCARTINIVCIGDSITQAFERNSYRRNLYLKLVAGGYTVDFVGSMNQDAGCNDFPASDFDPDHEGHWAWRVNRLFEGASTGCWGEGKLQDWLLGYDPDVAFIHAGSVDIHFLESVSSTIDDLETVIDILRADNPNIVIFLAQVIPIRFPENPIINELNLEIPGISTRKSTSSSPIIVVDQNTGFDAATDLYDDCHPNDSGEEKIAQKWFDAFDAYFKKTVPGIDTAGICILTVTFSLLLPGAIYIGPIFY